MFQQKKNYFSSSNIRRAVTGETEFINNVGPTQQLSFVFGIVKKQSFVVFNHIFM